MVFLRSASKKFELRPSRLTSRFGAIRVWIALLSSSGIREAVNETMTSMPTCDICRKPLKNLVSLLYFHIFFFKNRAKVERRFLSLSPGRFAGLNPVSGTASFSRNCSSLFLFPIITSPDHRHMIFLTTVIIYIYS